jgi:NADP-dependent 3-hydroxy acid dehydrogenase YdfG
VQLGDKVAVVTGASMGIGQASAKALHQVGFRVFGTTRRPLQTSVKGSR